MIAKEVPLRSLKKSDFAGLARYITDPQSKEYRLGLVQMTNCAAGSVRDAITEVLATQQANQRAKGDKTYHLLVSFRAGEQPSADTLRTIEERLCGGLGFGAHQRLSAVHHDTDNLHIHIAINKIHPVRGTMHEPYYSHRTLAQLCATLERDFGLETDNHQPRQTTAAARAADMERHSGQQSLVGWIKRDCLTDIEAAQSWPDLHRVLRAHGLELRARGNGLVIAAGDGTTLKASTLSRTLSKPALEKRLGPFEAPVAPQEPSSPPRGYRKGQPLRLRIDTTELYARYTQAQKGSAAIRAEALAEAKRRKDQAVEAAKKAAATKRTAIKLLGGSRLTKRLLYHQAHGALRADLEAVLANYQQERRRHSELHGRRSWADWLKQQALKGDAQALAALRAREAAQGLKGNTFAGRGQGQPSPTPEIDTITKKGTILFRAGSSAIRDDGDRLQVSRDADLAAVRAALHMARDRYGEQISVTGSAAFKAAVIKAAVDERMSITFADPVLERQRLALADTKMRSEIEGKKTKHQKKGRGL